MGRVEGVLRARTAMRLYVSWRARAAFLFPFLVTENGAGAELSAEFPGQLAVHRSRGAYETVDAVPGDFLRDGNCILVHEQYFIDRDSLAANRDANFSILSVRGV